MEGMGEPSGEFSPSALVPVCLLPTPVPGLTRKKGRWLAKALLGFGEHPHPRLEGPVSEPGKLGSEGSGLGFGAASGDPVALGFLL